MRLKRKHTRPKWKWKKSVCLVLLPPYWNTPTDQILFAKNKRKLLKKNDKSKIIAFNFNLLRFFKPIFNWVNFQFENLKKLSACNISLDSSLNVMRKLYGTCDKHYSRIYSIVCWFLKYKAWLNLTLGWRNVLLVNIFTHVKKNRSFIII